MFNDSAGVIKRVFPEERFSQPFLARAVHSEDFFEPEDGRNFSYVSAVLCNVDGPQMVLWNSLITKRRGRRVLGEIQVYGYLPNETLFVDAGGYYGQTGYANLRGVLYRELEGIGAVNIGEEPPLGLQESGAYRVIPFPQRVKSGR